ncbi:MAG: FkbM family methyltransferase [Dehalococcoidia bacterium]
MSVLLRLVRALASTPGFRKLTDVESLLRLSFALRGSLLRERLRFELNELRRRPRTDTYVLRASPVAVSLRHRTPDVLVLDEIFSQRHYTFPPQVLQALAPVGAGPRVVDLGANIGLFGAWVLVHFPRASILALEPDPDNARVHSLAIAANRPSEWKLIQAAAGTTRGTVDFVAGSFTRSRLARGDEGGIEVPVEDVFDHLAGVDLFKMDIEGGEWELLADPSFAASKARTVVIEYHPDLCPWDDPAEAAERLLHGAGYEVFPGLTHVGEGVGVLWGVRR